VILPRRGRVAGLYHYIRMDRHSNGVFQTLFDSLKREMHQEFDDLRARLDRMEARQDRQGGEAASKEYVSRCVLEDPGHSGGRRALRGYQAPVELAPLYNGWVAGVL
jgi:hypothetical protein